MNTSAAALWQAYLRTLTDPRPSEIRWYECFKIGNTTEGADLGVQLILEGTKKATSSLVWEYVTGDKEMPQVGSLSIVQDGQDQAVCVIETTALEIRKFDEVDADFARDYGEGDGTLAGWRQLCWDYYADQCREMGWDASDSMPLLCERFRVVYPV